MRLKLTRPLVILDVETTGVHPQVDRIVQIGLVKLYPGDRWPTEWLTLINPCMLIPPEVTRVHGITDAMVADAPRFAEIASKLAGGLKDCDLGGFNVRFDLLFLKNEFSRVGGKTVLDGAKIVDPFRIYSQREPRTLTAAYEYYTGKKLEGAHDALVDARAAAEVLISQLERYPDLPDTVDELHRVYFEQVAEGFLDPDGKLAWRHGLATINFGKWATIPLARVDKGYLKWMMDGDFTPEVKHIIGEALKGSYPRRD